MELFARYLRKSRAEEGLSLAEVLAKHKAALDDLAKRLNLIVVDTYEEVVSGENLEGRPQMLALLDAVEAGTYAGVLCMDIDRLGRGGMRDQGTILDTFRLAKCKIITPDRIYDLNDDTDEELTEFKAFFARREYKAIRKRMQRGKMATIQSGGYVSNAPFGYRQIRADKKPTLEVVPEEADLVQRMYQSYADGVGPMDIANSLNASGVKPRRGGPWNRSTVRVILANPVYAGMIRYNVHNCRKNGKFVGSYKKPEEEWITVPGIHPAIIDEELWQRVAERRRTTYRGVHYDGTIKHQFTGLLRCSCCGSLLRTYAKNGSDTYLICPTKGCSASAKEAYVEKAVVSALQAAISNLEAENQAAKSDPIAEAEHDLESLESKKAQLSKKANRIYEFYEDGSYDRDTFLHRMGALDEESSALEKQIASVQDRIRALSDATHQIQAERLQSALDAFGQSDPVRRNTLLRAVVSSITYAKEKKSKPADLTVKLNLRTDFGSGFDTE